ncbi:MAG: beta-ketoacyl synthase N-terminal-like domain-containing protein [Rubrivivax sp.]|jgi:3-oxoacyl-[acyl-carrier-protein] synthase-1
MPAPPTAAPAGILTWTQASACGLGRAALAQALRSGHSGLQPLQSRGDLAELAAWGRVDPPLHTWVGVVPELPQSALPAALADWDCRPNRLSWHTLQLDGFAATVAAQVQRWGAHRVGVVLGTSAATIGASEAAYRHLDAAGQFPPDQHLPHLHTPHALAAFVRRALGLRGPAATVSTACSSSAKALVSAERWLQTGVCDAVVVAGVEALSGSLLYGFRALGLVAEGPCRPFDAERQGISIGEAAAFALLVRAEDTPTPWQMTGHGESNDAHHMSTPHPQGLGAELALDAALARAGVTAADVDFVNLHGTASQANDAVEAALLARRYAPTVHACATKGQTGHTMGAAGLLEAAVCWLALAGEGRAGSTGHQVADAAFGPVFAQQLRVPPAAGAVRLAASHSFGFGGNNAVLLFSAGEALTQEAA